MNQISAKVRGWGKIIVGTRLEKNVSAAFVQCWSALITTGLQPGDGYLITRGMVAHKAANDLVRRFLKTDADTLLMLDSDADIESDLLSKFREYEPGYAYDVLQAFYCRRGWPPRPIWIRENALGQTVEAFILDPDTVEDVAVAGTHCCLIRRHVLEAMLGSEDPEKFEWFWYTRHTDESEDGVFSRAAREFGFAVGATTHVKAGHLCELTTDWASYMDFLDYTGRLPLIDRYKRLCGMVGTYTKQTADLVAAKAIIGVETTRDYWRKLMPQNPREERAFYGDRENGYLEGLVWWNCQPIYERMIKPLRNARLGHCLVVGAGLGSEVEALLNSGNTVDVFELPGALRDFLAWRFADTKGVTILQGDTLGECAMTSYDLIVALDVIEHIHPDELPNTLDVLDDVLKKTGLLYVHNNFSTEEGRFPQHHDHTQAWAQWAAQAGLHQTEELQWRRRTSSNA